MFTKLSLIAVAAFAALASASESGQCTTGAQYCCNSVQSANSPQASHLCGALGLILGGDIPVGLGCSALDVAGISGNSCTEQPVCCNGDDFNGLVVVGCSPITINL